jgi:hypothetical protein
MTLDFAHAPSLSKARMRSLRARVQKLAVYGKDFGNAKAGGEVCSAVGTANLL